MERTEHNVETGIVRQITMTNDEVKEKEKEMQAAADSVALESAKQAEADAAKAAAQAKLAALGLTADDLKALGL